MSTERNAAFFKKNSRYEADVLALDTYAWTRLAVQSELSGCERLLDIGNGGFFNYDIADIDHVRVLDLFLDSHETHAPNVHITRGDVLECTDLDLGGKFDVILLQMLIHHVTGKTVSESIANLQRIFFGLKTHLAPGGRLVVIESTVPSWFFAFERIVFERLNKVWRFAHPLTLQYTPERILNAAQDAGFRIVEYSHLPRGRWLLQFGMRVPSFVTPVQPIKLVLALPEDDDTSP